MEDMEDALATKTQTVEELSRELEEIRAAFGTEGIQQVNIYESITDYTFVVSEKLQGIFDALIMTGFHHF